MGIEDLPIASRLCDVASACVSVIDTFLQPWGETRRCKSLTRTIVSPACRRLTERELLLNRLMTAKKSCERVPACLERERAVHDGHGVTVTWRFQADNGRRLTVDGCITGNASSYT